MTWAFVQQTSGQQTGSSLTLTTAAMGSSVTAGHLVVITVGYGTSVGSPTITDSGSNTWTLAQTSTSSGGALVGTYYSVITTGGTLTFTATWSTGTAAIAAMIASEYSFTPGTLTLLSADNSAVGATSFTCGSVSFSNPVAAIGCLEILQTTTTTWTAYTLRHTVAYNAGIACGVSTADLLNTSTSPQNPAGTFSTNTDYSGATLIFQSSGDVPLVAGTASTSSSGNTIATVVVTNASGGAGGYTYQWYRSTTSGFTPGSGNIVSGATSQTLHDTGLTNGTTYYYKNVVTDSASNTATSNQTSATPSAGAASITLAPNTVVINSTGNSILVTGTNTSWTPGTPGTPTFTASAGTIVSQIVSSSTTATLIYSAPATVQTVTITDPSTSATASLAISAAPPVPTTINVAPQSAYIALQAYLGYPDYSHQTVIDYVSPTTLQCAVQMANVVTVPAASTDLVVNLATLFPTLRSAIFIVLMDITNPGQAFSFTTVAGSSRQQVSASGWIALTANNTLLPTLYLSNSNVAPSYIQIGVMSN